ncbi:MAG TPA: methyltransferase domain-containing protein [Candidatus Sulfotelmatobacter sp.]|jgi:hypothetical protein|nr:methyltransferase domain-containing protein [Candidatus Sulfotelmatobacter sp.]
MSESIYNSDAYIEWYLGCMATNEKNGRFNVERNLKDYMRSFPSLVSFLEYVRYQTESNKILDIGAGKAVGINELAGDPLGEGLDFTATGLVAPYNSTDEPNKVPYLTTSGEFLAGVTDESIGGVLSLHSITYTPSRQKTVNALDRVLVPGGIVMTKVIETITSGHKGLFITKADEFEPHFKGKGYDTASQIGSFSAILVARKPGGRATISAQQLLQKRL